MDRARILSSGILVGFAGATAVALWFLLYDLAAGIPFRTPALLGAALFEGLRDPAALTIPAGPGFARSLGHGLGFLVSGGGLGGL